MLRLTFLIRKKISLSNQTSSFWLEKIIGNQVLKTVQVGEIQLIAIPKFYVKNIELQFFQGKKSCDW
jgi:hypothetical protein